MCSNSFCGLRKRRLVRVLADVDQRISVPTTQAYKEAPPLIYLWLGRAEHYLKAATSAFPHADLQLMPEAYHDR